MTVPSGSVPEPAERCICDGAAFVSRWDGDWHPFLAHPQCPIHGTPPVPAPTEPKENTVRCTCGGTLCSCGCPVHPCDMHGGSDD